MPLGHIVAGAADRGSRVQPLRRTRLRAPDLLRIFRDRPVARELARGGNIENDLVRPIVGLAVERAELTVGPKVRRQVSQVHELVAVGQERAAQRLEDSRLIRAEMIRQ